MGKTYCVISHTHWDREWYSSFEHFRMRLVYLIDNLLEILKKHKDYKFHLDAQTIVLEDYLEIRPEKKAILKRYITEGRIRVGPWYVQNDLALTSGEATIRNLIIGRDIAKSFGKCSMTGYVPDQFGLIFQLPQIFARSGIESAIFARGYKFEQGMKAEFIWKSADGSEVLAVFMPLWYNNVQRFPSDIDESMKLLSIITERLKEVSGTDHYFLLNGVDLIEAQENLSPILDKINNRLPKGEKILHYTMDQYIKKIKPRVKNPVEYHGEMRDDEKIPANTLSSRVFLKQWNTRCQVLIEKRLEPLCSFIEMIKTGKYPDDYLLYLWKLLIKNHPHDSIGGCSIDRVHEQMMERFKSFNDAGEDLLNRTLEFFTSLINRKGISKGQYMLTLFNTNQEEQEGIITAEIQLPVDEKIKNFSIIDNNGVNLPYIISGKTKKFIEMITPVNLHWFKEVYSYKVKLQPGRIAPFSFSTFIIKPEKEPLKNISKQKSTELKSTPGTIENKYLKVKINANGSIDLYHKESKKDYKGLLLIEDKEDIGNFYHYEDNPKIKPLYCASAGARITKIEDDHLSISFSVKYDLSLPEKYDFKNNIRSRKKIKIPVELLLSLDKESKSLQVRINIENKVKDHRIRILFPTSIKTNISISGSPFDAVIRDKSTNKKGDGYYPERPNTTYINVDQEKEFGLAIFNEGLYEYENLKDVKNTIALTLLRGNGQNNSKLLDFYAFNEKTAPGNQCLGKHSFNLAIFPHKGDHLSAEIHRKAESFLNPLVIPMGGVPTQSTSL